MEATGQVMTAANASMDGLNAKGEARQTKSFVENVGLPVRANLQASIDSAKAAHAVVRVWALWMRWLRLQITLADPGFAAAHADPTAGSVGHIPVHGVPDAYFRDHQTPLISEVPVKGVNQGVVGTLGTRTNLSREHSKRGTTTRFIDSHHET